MPPSAHFNSSSLATSDVLMFDRIQNLTAMNQELLSQQEVSIIVSKHGFLWWGTIASTIVLSIVVIALLAFNVRQSQRIKTSHKTVAKNVSEMLTYRTLNAPVSSRTKTNPVQNTVVSTNSASPSSSKPDSKVEVGRNDSITVNFNGRPLPMTPVI